MVWGMASSAPVLPRWQETGILSQLRTGRHRIRDPQVGGRCEEQRSWGPGFLGSGPWASSAPRVRGPGSCPHFLPFLAPALGERGRGGERKGRKGPRVLRGSTGGAEKPGRGLSPGTRSGAGGRQEQRPGTRAGPHPFRAGAPMARPR